MGLFDFFKKKAQVRESMGDAAISLSNSAVLYMHQGLYAQAESQFKQALALYEEYVGLNCPAVAKCLYNLAKLYDRQGQYAQAELFYKRALAIKEKGLGPDHPDVAENLNNLAFLCLAQGQFAQAELHFKRALAILENILGTDHPSVGVTLNNLAYLYDTQGNCSQAEPLYKRSLATWERATGLDHPDVAPPRNIFNEIGKQFTATDLSHPDVASSLNKIAMFYYGAGQYAQAELLCKRVLEISEENHGPEHPNVVQSLENLAELYRRIGQEMAAGALEERIAAIQQHPPRGNNMQTLNATDSCTWAFSKFDVTADTEDWHLDSMIRTTQGMALEEGYILDTDAVKEMYLRRRTLMRPPVWEQPQ